MTLSNEKLLQFLLIIMCLVVFYYLSLSNPNMHPDFDAFYFSGQALLENNNPYLKLNLNPPVFFIIFYPFMKLNNHLAYISWLVCMAIAYIASLHLSYKIFMTEKFNKKIISTLFLLSFPVLISFVLGQITALIYLLIIVGYYFHLKNNTLISIFSWAIATSIKFFPALILFYLIKQKQYAYSLLYIFITIIIFFLPTLFYDINIYNQYYKAINSITWYSHTWNISLTTIPFKLFLNRSDSIYYFQILKEVSFFNFIIIFSYYLYFLFKKSTNNHQPFCLIICFMCLLNPLSWIYYLPLLFMPILYVLNHITRCNQLTKITFFSLIILICMPLANNFIPSDNYSWPLILVLYTGPTIGMLLLTFIILTHKKLSKNLNLY